MISINEQDTVGLLKALVTIDSVNPSLMPNGPGEAEAARYLEQYMEEAGFEVHRTEIEPNRENVVGIIRSSDRQPGRTLMLNGHTDTVGVGKMDIDPFDGVEQDGKIYGRGAADMKSGVAAMVSAAAAVVQSEIPLRGDVIVACVADEEYASIGTEALVNGYTADAAIVTEPTGMEMTIAHKGFAWIDIETIGYAAHGSNSAKGIDAITMMGDVLRELRRLETDTLAIRSHSLLTPPSLHASIIEGGKELSTYPDHCKLQVERRTVPGETREMVETEIALVLDICRQADADFQAKSDVFFYREPLEIDRDAEIVRTLHGVIEKNLHREPTYNSSPGWMDSGILCAAGIPTVIFGPTGEGFHAPVEFAYRDSVVQCAQIFADAIVAFCGTATT